MTAARDHLAAILTEQPNHRWRALAETLIKATRWEEWRRNGLRWQNDQITDLSSALARWLPDSEIIAALAAGVRTAEQVAQIEADRDAAERWLANARENVEKYHRRADSAEAELAETRARLAAVEGRIERTDRLISSWERDAPDHSNPVFIGRLRETLRRDPAPVRLRGVDAALARPEGGNDAE